MFQLLVKKLSVSIFVIVVSWLIKKAAQVLRIRSCSKCDA